MRASAFRLIAALAACAGFAALAQDEPPVERLTGTLAKVKASGYVTIAHRESSIPFSYLSVRGEPIGYSIDLCRSVVEAMGQSLGRDLEIRWLPVTSESRIDAIASGKADLECGSTTSNLERSKRVAFSPTIFVSGTKLMVRRGSPIKSFRDLAGKTVVVTAGTTNEATMREIARKFRLEYKLNVARDHAESFAQVVQGRADAFATDDVLLYGLIAQNNAAGKFDVVGEFLSYDPYGVMYRKADPQMQRFMVEAFRDLADDGEIERQYKRWFMKRLPTSNATLGLPMSPQLESIVRAMAVRPE
jgi:glutamate/aspartate transport system substrate-binding protein